MTVQAASSAPAQIVHLWHVSPLRLALAVLVGVAAVAGVVAVWAP